MLLLIAIALNILIAPPAWAAVPSPLSIDDCVGVVLPPPAYTQKIVLCVGGNLVQAGTAVATALSFYISYTTIAAFIFAITWYGVSVVGGQRQPTQRMISILIRFFIIVIYLVYCPGFIQLWVSILQQFLTIINGPYNPWGQIDNLIGKLIGILPGLTIAQGLIGVIGASLFSSTAGIFLFMAGFSAVLDLFLFIFNIVFTYLLALCVIIFMFAISPLVAPLLLFYTTERYFHKWWHIIVSATLVPILMMTFLYYFLQIFNRLIVDIFDILGFPCSNPLDFTTCDFPDYRAYQKMNQPKFSWVMPSDPNMSQNIQTITTSSDMSVPAVQSNVNPFLRRGFDKNLMNSPGLDFGPNHVAIVQQLLFAFITLWIFASLFKSIIQKIPNIADDIAGALNRITIEPTQIENTIRRTARMDQSEMQKTASNVSENMKETLNRARYMITGGRSRGK